MGREGGDRPERPRPAITATPARHGPAHADRGPVIGFLPAFCDDSTNGLYISGDTVWHEGVQQVATRFSIRTAVLFLGAARVAAVGEWNLTLTAAEAVEAARVLSGATIVPLHFEGWEHFDQAFAAAGLQHSIDLAHARLPDDRASFRTGLAPACGRSQLVSSPSPGVVPCALTPAACCSGSHSARKSAAARPGASPARLRPNSCGTARRIESWCVERTAPT